MATRPNVSVVLKRDEPIERALRRFKRLCQHAGITKLVKSKRFYEKPSDARRREVRKQLRNRRRAERKANERLQRKLSRARKQRRSASNFRRKAAESAAAAAAAGAGAEAAPAPAADATAAAATPTES
jgi:small subunit ribosomal protein S21